MKRDVALVQKILSELEKDQDPRDSLMEGATPDALAYHVQILVDGGYVARIGDNKLHLTWSGHNLHDLIASYPTKVAMLTWHKNFDF